MDLKETIERGESIMESQLYEVDGFSIKMTFYVFLWLLMLIKFDNKFNIHIIYDPSISNKGKKNI